MTPGAAWQRCGAVNAKIDCAKCKDRLVMPAASSSRIAQDWAFEPTIVVAALSREPISGVAHVVAFASAGVIATRTIKPIKTMIGSVIQPKARWAIPKAPHRAPAAKVTMAGNTRSSRARV